MNGPLKPFWQDQMGDFSKKFMEHVSNKTKSHIQLALQSTKMYLAPPLHLSWQFQRTFLYEFCWKNLFFLFSQLY